jgi:uncharacterized SAM-binding protein YcdF (DUF218 family)
MAVMKRFVAGLGVAAMVAGVMVAGTVFGIGWFLSPQDKLEKSDAVVAISGGETVSRASEAIKLYEEGWAKKIIFSGAALDPNGPSNALAMKRVALGEGVPGSDILIEETSTNTIENAAEVAKLVEDNQIKSLILVTSPYHQRRASLTFGEALGDEVKLLNHSTTDQNWRRSRWWNNDYSYRLTLDEAKKTLYVMWSNSRH